MPRSASTHTGAAFDRTSRLDGALAEAERNLERISMGGRKLRRSVEARSHTRFWPEKPLAASN
jgi:hypothetical protein